LFFILFYLPERTSNSCVPTACDEVREQASLGVKVPVTLVITTTLVDVVSSRSAGRHILVKLRFSSLRHM
jgi:hypothetical protein